MDITYTLNLVVTRPVYLHDTDVTARDTADLRDTAEWMQSTEAKRELEKEVLHALRKIDGDCDVEVMDTEAVGEIEDDEPDEPCLPDGTPLFPSQKLTRTEREQGMADRGCDTQDEARGNR